MTQLVLLRGGGDRLYSVDDIDCTSSKWRTFWMWVAMMFAWIWFFTACTITNHHFGHSRILVLTEFAAGIWIGWDTIKSYHKAKSEYSPE